MRYLLLLTVLIQVGCASTFKAKITNTSSLEIDVGSVWNQSTYKKIESGLSKKVYMVSEPCFFIKSEEHRAVYNYNSREYQTYLREYKLGYIWKLTYDGLDVHVADKKGEIIFKLEKYTMDSEVDRLCTF